ncbi:hypothetical protein [Streptomyces atroolivaceus]
MIRWASGSPALLRTLAPGLCALARRTGWKPSGVVVHGCDVGIWINRQLD